MPVIVTVGVRPTHRRAGKRYEVAFIRAQVSRAERARWSDQELADQIAKVAGHDLRTHTAWLQGEGDSEDF